MSDYCEIRVSVKRTSPSMDFRVYDTGSHQAASRLSVGGDARFWPEGAAAGSHCTAASLKPQPAQERPQQRPARPAKCYSLTKLSHFSSTPAATLKCHRAPVESCKKGDAHRMC